MRKQSGTFLVIMALVLLLLVAIGALVLDLGRVGAEDLADVAKDVEQTLLTIIAEAR